MSQLAHHLNSGTHFRIHGIQVYFACWVLGFSSELWVADGVRHGQELLGLLERIVHLRGDKHSCQRDLLIIE